MKSLSGVLKKVKRLFIAWRNEVMGYDALSDLPTSQSFWGNGLPELR
jgi:hypothetical protein